MNFYFLFIGISNFFDSAADSLSQSLIIYSLYLNWLVKDLQVEVLPSSSTIVLLLMIALFMLWVVRIIPID
jgi:hypothetical protein